MNKIILNPYLINEFFYCKNKLLIKFIEIGNILNNLRFNYNF